MRLLCLICNSPLQVERVHVACSPMDFFTMFTIEIVWILQLEIFRSCTQFRKERHLSCRVLVFCFKRAVIQSVAIATLFGYCGCAVMIMQMYLMDLMMQWVFTTSVA